MAFPTTLDIEADVGGAATPVPDTTDPTDNPSHAGLHQKVGDAIVATQTKIGTGSSTPAIGRVFMGTGSGTSAWELNPDIGGTLDVTGAVTFDSTLNVTGAITGSLTGNADTATAATNITMGAAPADPTMHPVLVGAASATDQAPKYDTGLVWNSSTNALTATTFVGALTGNATTASAWATGRTISLTGDVTGTSAAWTGSGNISITATVGDDSHNHVPSNIDAGDFGTGLYRFDRVQIDDEILLAAGSAADCSLQHVSNAGTGIHFASTTDMRLTINGSSICRVLSTAFRSNGDNTHSLGVDGGRWSAVWAVNGTIQTSDVRFKTWLDEPLGLGFIKDLTALSGEWTDNPGEQHEWLSAQNVRQALDRHGRPNKVGMWHKQTEDPETGEAVEDGTESLNYAEMIPVLVRAVQELAEKVDA